MAKQSICAIQGCGKTPVKRGMCNMHYLRWWKHGNAEYTRTYTPKTCKTAGCSRRARSLGWCQHHYRRWYCYGDPLGEPERRTKSEIFWKETVLPYKGDDCLIWPFAWRLRYDGFNHIPSRFICEMVHGKPPTDSHEAAHSCGNGSIGCVNPNHLRWATQLENTLDKCEHGSVKLTPDDVREIRRLRGTMLQKDIAARFGVDQSMISYIYSGRSWWWVE